MAPRALRPGGHCLHRRGASRCRPHPGPRGLTNTGFIGIDITHLAITRIKKRLRDSFGEVIDRSRATVGEPVSLPDPGAPGLAKQDADSS